MRSSAMLFSTLWPKALMRSILARSLRRRHGSCGTTSWNGT
jgi:hypothetical protein